jgi:hypothetical protein
MKYLRVCCTYMCEQRLDWLFKHWPAISRRSAAPPTTTVDHPSTIHVVGRPFPPSRRVVWVRERGGVEPSLVRIHTTDRSIRIARPPHPCTHRLYGLCAFGLREGSRCALLPAPTGLHAVLAQRRGVPPPPPSLFNRFILPARGCVLLVWRRAKHRTSLVRAPVTDGRFGPRSLTGWVGKLSTSRSSLGSHDGVG